MLGGSGRLVELKPSDYQMAREDALRQFNQWIKKHGNMYLENIITLPGADTSYNVTMPVGTEEVINLNFLLPNIATNYVTNIFLLPYYLAYNNPAPRVSDMYMTEQYRKTFTRTSGTQPWWLYNKITNLLQIYAPAGPYNVGIEYVSNYASPQEVISDYDNLLLRMCLNSCKKILGRIRSKFNDTIEGDTTTISLDGNKLLQEAAAEDTLITEKLRSYGMTPFVVRS